jgi:peptidyl-dipeptidase Dcp
MRRLLLAGASALVLAAPVAAAAQSPAAAPAAAAPAAANPLLGEWKGPYGGVPPWDQSRPEYYPAALQAGIDEEKAEIDAIVADKAAPTFENTIAAMQRSGATRDRVERMFAVMTGNIGSPEFQALDKEWSPRQSAADDAVVLNPGLFQRIEAVYRGLPNSKLTAEQKRLTTRTYDAFVRRGAKLTPDQKAQLIRMNQELAGLFSDFSRKVLADENTWTVIDDEAGLAGLPASYASAARAAAAERGLAGKWVVVNTRSSVDPFLTFSSDRALRQKVWTKFKNRGDNGDANDTNETIAKIVRLRADRAHLLGFATHANFRMADTMARDPATAKALMMKVWVPAVQRVKEEVADMQAAADRDGAKITIEPWDYLYYAEKVRKAKYDLDQGQIKPYFELNKMIDAAFYAAERRYGTHFTEITGKVPVFHPEVRVWEVTDAKSGKHVGLFYGDYFARAGKRSGAWAFGYRTQSTYDGPVTTLTSNNNNFVKAAPGEPVLISLDDARTLFHEFGHALHGLLSNVTYPGLAGTPRDFVEYPSQVNENWVLTRDVLDKFARHYKTGEAMPQALLDKIDKSSKFNQGYITVEALGAAIADMDLHTIPDGVVDPDSFEREELVKIGMPKEIALRHRLPQFNHLFSSDSYSAGYYSYIWSDVMAADTWKAFQEAGSPWDQKTADRFRTYILSTGNATDRAEAYRAFRGRDPDVNALLENRGFPTTPAAADGG